MSASDLKAKGNEFFKTESFNEAIRSYTEALQLLPPPQDSSILHSNLAAVYLAIAKYDEVVRHASLAMDTDSSNVKALYRRAVAYQETGKLNEARLDLERAIQIEPGNSSASTLYSKVKKALSSGQPQVEAAVSVVTNAGIPDKERISAVKDLKKRCTLASEAALVCTRAETIWKASYTSSLEVSKECIELLSIISSHPACLSALLKAVPVLDVSSRLPVKPEVPVASEVDTYLACVLLLHNMGKGDEASLPHVMDTFVRLCKVDTRLSVQLVRHCLDCISRLLESKLSLSLFTKSKGWDAIYFFFGHEEASLGHSASVTLTRALVLVKDEGEEALKAQCLKILAPRVSSAGEESLTDSIRGVTMLKQIFLVDTNVGVWFLQQEGALAKVCSLARSPSVEAQTLSVECLASASTVKDGRNLMGDEVKFVLTALLDAESDSIRSAAALTLSKLSAGNTEGGASREIGDDEMGLLEVSLDLIANCKGSEQERGLESLTALVGNTEVKNIVSQSPQALKEICEMAKTSESRLHFGLAAIFSQLASNIRADQQKKVESMEMNEETFMKFQELTKSGQMKFDRDTESDCSDRIVVLVTCGVIPALVTLSKGASDPLLEAVSNAFNRIASVQQVRGTVVQQGGISSITSIEKKGNEVCQKNARSALSRVLISTNPHLLSSGARMDCIVPLKKQLEADHELLQFEALLALTNIASVGDEEKALITDNNGLGKIENVLCTDNMQLRQAATETMCNLASTDAMFEFLASSNRAKLWVALADDWEEHPGISSAAAATLASVLADVKVAQAFEDTDLCKVLLRLAKCGNDGLVLRAVASLNSLAVSKVMSKSLKEANAVGVCQNMLIGASRDSPLSEYLKMTLESLQT